MSGLAFLVAVAVAAPPPAPAATVATSLRIERETGAVREMSLEAGQNRLLILSEPIRWSPTFAW
jgi:pilus assembly protein CpaC